MTLPRFSRFLACAAILAAAALCAHAQSNTGSAPADETTSRISLDAESQNKADSAQADEAAVQRIRLGDDSQFEGTASTGNTGVAPLGETTETQTPLQLFALASNAYDAGDSAEAVALFSRLADQWPNAVTYYNLGNAYFRSGQYGRAIAAYEKAHALDHTQPDVVANLNRAKEAARISPSPVGRWEHFARKLSPNTWTLLLAVSFWAALGLWLIPAQYRKPHGIWRPSLLALAIALLVLCALGLYPWRVLARAGTVLEGDTPLLLAPVATSPVQTYAQAGQPAQWVRSHGDFDRIRLPDGTEGWVNASQFTTTWNVQQRNASD